MITIARFNYPHEVALIEAELIAAEIPYFLKNINTITANVFYSYALGGIELQVPETAAEAALEIVNRYRQAPDQAQEAKYKS